MYVWDLTNGLLTLNNIPDLGNFFPREKTWEKRDIDGFVTLHGFPRLNGFVKDPGYGFAGDLVVVDDGVETVMPFWYINTTPEGYVSGSYLVINLKGNLAVSKLKTGDKNGSLRLGDLYL